MPTAPKQTRSKTFTISEIKDLTNFFKEKGVAAFELGDIKVSFDARSFKLNALPEDPKELEKLQLEFFQQNQVTISKEV